MATFIYSLFTQNKGWLGFPRADAPALSLTKLNNAKISFKARGAFCRALAPRFKGDTSFR